MRTNSSRITKAALTAVGVVAIGGASVVTATMPANAQTSDGWGTVHARGGLNIRTAPSTHASLQGRLDDGQKVFIQCAAGGTGSSDGGEQWDTTWYLVSLGTGSNGWISGHYVQASRSVDQCADAATTRGQTTSAVTLREAPNTADVKVGHLAKQASVKLVCKVTSQPVRGNATWYLTNKDQWVSARYVRNVGVAPRKCA